MARVFDNCNIRVKPAMQAAISDAMKGNANEIIKALNDSSNIIIIQVTDEIYGIEKSNKEATATVANASGSNNLMDYVFSYVGYTIASPGYIDPGDTLAKVVYKKDATLTELFRITTPTKGYVGRIVSGQINTFEIRIAV